MALSLLPTPTELAGLGDLAAIRLWTGLGEDVWDAASRDLGGIPNVRMFAFVPADTFRDMLARVRIPVRASGSGAPPAPRECSAIELVQLAVMWRVARQAYGLPDWDILSPTPPAHVTAAAGTTTAGATPSLGAKKIKLAVHLDQMDDNEVEIITRADLEDCYRQYRDVTGSDPQPDADPTSEQVTGMRSKIIDRGESPYADFSVLVPYGKELQKQMKARSWLLQEDGSWKSVDVPGPPSYTAWLKCWRVYRTLLLMLKHPAVAPAVPKPVVTIAALEEYADKIYELVSEFPECYYLVWQADDRCRRDEFERIRRSLTRARLNGTLPMNVQFDPDQPWVGVFTYAARDGEYWARHVVRPAQTFLARGGGGKPMSKEHAEGAWHDKDWQHPGPGQGLSRNARKRRAEKQRKEEEVKKRQQDWSGGSGNDRRWKQAPAIQHPRKFGGTFITTREGTEICYKFSKGAADSCPEPCPDGRAHVCQYCLGGHQNATCPKKGEKGKGKGGKTPSK